MDLSTTIRSYLSDLYHQPVEILSVIPLSGGDINEVFKVSTTHGIFCLKKNQNNKYPQMLEKEAMGLRELSQNSQFKIPEVIGHFEDSTRQYLLLEFINEGTKDNTFWKDFGNKLARMHSVSNNYFGWKTSNYIGSLVQTNATKEHWSDFYAEERILPQMELAFNTQSIDKKLSSELYTLCGKFPSLFPMEPPALIHGDLWSGNYLVDNDGAPVLIDPALSYGHREMDLGMMQLFGGFSKEVFTHYNDVYPLEKSWEDRIPLTQLYPLLVHVNLFGGSYVASVRSIVRLFL